MVEYHPVKMLTKLVQWRMQAFPSMGAKDPRLDQFSKEDFRLTCMYSAGKKVDNPPSQVKPVPMVLLLQAADLATPSVYNQATIDCIWMAFCFFLRPGKYANASGDARHPFCLQDMEFKNGAQHFVQVECHTALQFLSATFVSLTFSTQKNGLKGEKLADATNGQAQACPVHAVMCRVAHLVHHNAPVNTPLHVYYIQGGQRCVSSAMISSLLWAAALSMPGHTGVDPNNIAACSLCSSGAMVLLLGGKDPDKICILGQWCSDAMFRYLHSHALLLIQDNSTIMFCGGHYTLVACTPAAPP